GSRQSLRAFPTPRPGFYVSVTLSPPSRAAPAPHRANPAAAQLTAPEFWTAAVRAVETGCMTTTPVLSSTQPNSTNQLKTNKLALKAEDFIKMMVTQLQQQDPTEPAKNDQLLAQMSQIGQLEASTQLQDSLKGLVLQNQISSAASLIGKSVQGMD